MHAVCGGVRAALRPVPGDFDLWPFKLFWARDQTRLPCEFGANPFSRFPDIWGTVSAKTTLLAYDNELRWYEAIWVLHKIINIYSDSELIMPWTMCTCAWYRILGVQDRRDCTMSCKHTFFRTGGGESPKSSGTEKSPAIRPTNDKNICWNQKYHDKGVIILLFSIAYLLVIWH